jgi:hypothetical protein
MPLLRDSLSCANGHRWQVHPVYRLTPDKSVNRILEAKARALAGCSSRTSITNAFSCAATAHAAMRGAFAVAHPLRSDRQILPQTSDRRR